MTQMTPTTPTTHQPIFSGQPWNERQLAILVGLCVAACREVLQTTTGETIAPHATTTDTLSAPYAPNATVAPQEARAAGEAGTTISFVAAQNQKGKVIGTMASRNTDLSSQSAPAQSEAVLTSNAGSNAPEPKLLLTVEEAAARLSVGRPKMWQLVMHGDVLSLKIGASRRVPVAALEEYVQHLCAAEKAERSNVYGKQH